MVSRKSSKGGGGGGPQILKVIKESMKLNWNFLSSGECCSDQITLRKGCLI